MKIYRLICWFIVLSLTACAPRTAPTQVTIPTPTQMEMAITSTPAPTRPEPRAGHEIVYDAALQMVLLVNVGSESSELGVPAKIWGWDGLQWRVVNDERLEGRNLGGVAYDSKRNVLVVYGGWSPNKCYNDTWEWNGQTWSKLPVEGPGVCDHFAMVYDSRRGRVVLFGGQDPGMTLHGDTWEWDGSSWAKVIEESNTTPPKRTHYALGYDSEREVVLMFGGYSPTLGDLNDLWAWNGITWSEIKRDESPSARTGARMAFDAKRKVMVLQGGNRNNTMLNETWTWNGKKWTQVESENLPARGYHAMTYDPIRERVVLFGGQSGLTTASPLLGDTWEWDGKQWVLVDAP